MTFILILSVAGFIATRVIQGFNLWSVTSFVSTLLFCGRKVGYFCKMRHIMALEIVGAFITEMFALVIGTFQLKAFIITVVIRLLFIAVAYYDMTAYVYVQEKRRKDNKEEEL